jgi:adenylosuccinate lyase
VLLALVEKGMAREEAYEVVHHQAMESWETTRDFRDMMRSEPEVNQRLSSEELEKLFDYKYYVHHVDEIFERVGLA